MALLVAVPCTTASAQEPLVLAGRLVQVRGADTTALVGATVVAHRVGRVFSGPIDSVRSSGGGRFTFRIARPDTGVVYVVSSRHLGIGYFSEPFTTRNADGSDRIVLAVFDTSSLGVPLDIAIRHLVITRPDSTGRREVLDVIQVRNSDRTARVSSGPGAPAWSVRLPAGVLDPVVGEGEVPPEAVSFGGGSAQVDAIFPPGARQVVFSYGYPGGRRSLGLEVDQPVARLEVLVEDPGATAQPPLRALEPLSMEGRRFTRFAADSLAQGTQVTIRLAGAGSRARPLIAVIAALLLLGGAALVALGRRGAPRRPAAGAVGDRHDTLLAQIVALDERFAGREVETPPDQWEAYLRRRAELKARLAELLPR